MITDGPLPGPAGPALNSPTSPAWFTAAPALAGLASNRQELKVPAADSAFQRADDRARIVVRTGDIQRLAILTEGDGARAGPRTEMPLGGSEIRMRAETQLARVHNRTEHHLAGQLDGRLKRITVVSREKVADEPRRPRSSMISGPRAFFTPRQ